MDFWSPNLVSSGQEIINEFLQATPQKLYLMASDVFEDLRFISECVIEGNLDKDHYTEDQFEYDIEIPMYAIVSYCDMHTNIDAKCVIELLQALYLEITNTNVAEGIPTELGPKRSKKEILCLANQSVIVGFRFGNRLYAMATSDQRKGIYEAKRIERQLRDAIIEIGTTVIAVNEDGDNEYFSLQKCIDELSKDFPECKKWSTERYSSRLKRYCQKDGIDPPKRKTGRPKNS
ncbi:hypothetical protein [uncultured Gimesia sp.]|uniref:hypothetical protein n=1 Tax=uncultured Gimesia sp. TaxID=1678688 RepID=UPI00261B1C88|nr:hypothetical protein [uncultured Gimesia sp.]